MKILFIISLFFFLQCVSDKKPNSCDVFLNNQNHQFQEIFTLQLKELEFLGCEKTKEHQLQV